ncbi:MAG: hypothetical protein GY679_01275 [Mycoplasma sp.]|nr:hypothetical protein [Mycoplasma sp.]
MKNTATIQAIINSPIVMTLLILILVFVLVLLFLLIKNGYSFKTKIFQIEKTTGNKEKVVVSIQDLEIHFGGVETLEQEKAEKEIGKIESQLREAKYFTKELTSDMLTTFTEIFILKNLNKQHKEFSNTLSSLKYDLIIEIIDIVNNNHLDIPENEWEAKERDLTKYLSNVITGSIKNHYDEGLMGIDWHEFDHKFYNNHIVEIVRKVKKYVSKIREISLKCKRDVGLKNNHIELLKEFYKRK